MARLFRCRLLERSLLLRKAASWSASPRVGSTVSRLIIICRLTLSAGRLPRLTSPERMLEFPAVRILLAGDFEDAADGSDSEKVRITYLKKIKLLFTIVSKPWTMDMVLTAFFYWLLLS